MPTVLTASTTNNWQCAQPFERRHTHLSSVFPARAIHSLVQCLPSEDNTLTCQVSFLRGQYIHLLSVFPARAIHSLAQCLSSENNTLTCPVSFQRAHCPPAYHCRPQPMQLSAGASAGSSAAAVSLHDRSSVRRTLELFQRQRWGNLSETAWRA